MAAEKKKKRVLFTGYAQVHFVCFLPVYRILAEDPDVEVFLSGGFQRKEGDDVSYDLTGFYEPFSVDMEHVISLERVRRESFDVLVSAHLSDTLFPKSVGKKVQIFHGVSIKNLAVREKALRYDILCLPGRYHGELYRKNGLIRESGTEYFITGFPKTDSLATGSGLDREALLAGMGLDPKLPTILFAPTGEKYNALDMMGREVVEAISRPGLWNLLVKPHDHPKKNIDWFTELAPFESGRVRLVRDRDISPYLFAADLLITDMSSVAVEYTLMDRPIIFLDIPKLMRRVTKRAPALDLQTYGRRTGRLVSAPAELESAIKDSLANPDREGELRRSMAAHLFHDPGNAARNVAGVVRCAAGLARAVPEGVVVLETKE
ncbi:MAG: CDP-glycerol glycerophosphotransferase family protein [Thermodesulfobacteriota bacterium]